MAAAHALLPGSEFGSYDPTDVQWLSSDITEDFCRTGQYTTMLGRVLPVEDPPGRISEDLYAQLMTAFSGKLFGHAVARLAAQVVHRYGRDLVLASIVRAGVPAGIVLARHLKSRFGVRVHHYAISMIPTMSIDDTALKHITVTHPGKPVVFLDCWTGTGRTAQKLDEFVCAFNHRNGTDLDPALAAVLDPTHVAGFCGTHEDFPVPYAVLNATGSGLVSVAATDVEMGTPGSFHGAASFDHLRPVDHSNEVVDLLSRHTSGTAPTASAPSWSPDLDAVAARHAHDNVRLLRPAINETLRVLLRKSDRLDRIVIQDQDSPEVQPCLRLAENRGVGAQVDPDLPLKVTGILRS